MNKRIKYIIGLLVVTVILYNSVYFEPLDTHLASLEQVEFDSDAFVDKLWQTQLLPSFAEAPELVDLMRALENNPTAAFATHAQALGIGNIGYFRVQGEGKVIDINENEVQIQLGDRGLALETEFIYGNAIRDASGLVQINDFDDTSEFNSISESINSRIRQEVIPDFRRKVQAGDTVQFQGAMELNKAHLNLKQIEVIPISITINS